MGDPRGMIEALDLDSALSWHLQYNHVPTVPLEWLPVCKSIILGIREGQVGWDDEVANPVRGGTITVHKVVEGLHLHAFLE